jgi:hypothetical protein
MGFWSKLGKFASIAAPIVAAPFTGGATLALIGAGAGAAGGALSGGGLKGALLGGALGAIPGVGTAGKGAQAGLQAAGKAGVGAGLKAAAKSAITNPAVLSGVGKALGGMADTAAQNRGAQTEATLQRDQVGVNADAQYERGVQGRAGIDLARKADAREAENNAFRNAMRSAYARNVQDVSINRPAGVPTIRFSGGARPSAMGPEGREAAEAMNAIAMRRLLAGEQYEEMPALNRSSISPLPQAGFMEKWLGPIGMGMSTIGKLREEIAKRAQAQPPPIVPPRERVPIPGDRDGWME